MLVCPNCHNACPDNAQFCNVCGTPLSAANAAPKQEPPFRPAEPAAAPQAVYVDPADHTNEFDPKDISDNKVFAMAPYLLSWIGVIVALLAAKDSAYAAFHVRQSMKLVISSTLLALIAAFLCWTILVPIAAGVCAIILFVVKIICFFRVCSGKAIEAPIVRNFGFLK